jgi:hypothetical protein
MLGNAATQKATVGSINGEQVAIAGGATLLGSAAGAAASKVWIPFPEVIGKTTKALENSTQKAEQLVQQIVGGPVGSALEMGGDAALDKYEKAKAMQATSAASTPATCDTERSTGRDGPTETSQSKASNTLPEPEDKR